MYRKEEKAEECMRSRKWPRSRRVPGGGVGGVSRQGVRQGGYEFIAAGDSRPMRRSWGNRRRPRSTKRRRRPKNARRRRPSRREEKEEELEDERYEDEEEVECKEEK